MTRKTKKYWILAFALTLCFALCGFAACSLATEPKYESRLEYNANQYVEVEKTHLELAKGMAIDSPAVIVKCGVTLVDSDGRTQKIDEIDITSSRYLSYTPFDTSKIGSFKAGVTYDNGKEKKFTEISYDVVDYSVTFEAEGEEPYTVTPTISLADNLDLYCYVDLAGEYNYSRTTTDVAKGLLFNGWIDGEGNLATGKCVLQPPAVGYTVNMTFFARFLSADSGYNTSYSESGDRVFDSYTGDVIADGVLRIPEGTTVVSVANVMNSMYVYDNTGAITAQRYDSVVVPSTARVSDAPLNNYIDTRGLKAINVTAGNEHASSDHGILYSANKTELWLCPANVEGVLEFPASVILFRDFAFCYLQRTSLDIPSNVIQVGDYCFASSALQKVNGINSVVRGTNIFFDTALASEIERDGVLYQDLYKDGSAYEVVGLADPTLTSIKFIPHTVSVASAAFRDNTTLKNVDFGTDLKTIGSMAFYNCTALESAILPDSLEVMGIAVFYNCTSLKEANVPDITTIYEGKLQAHCLPSNTFQNCEALEKVTLADELQIIDSWAFSYAKSLKEITLPSALIGIGAYGFQNSGLTSVTFPQNLQTIEIQAFYACNSLASVDLTACMDTLEKIGITAFAATAITSFVVPNKVTEIGTQTFYKCSRLASVTLHDGVKSLGIYAFRETGLTSIDLSGVETIGQSVFYGCTKLTSVTLSDSVRSIGGYAFRLCSGLTSFRLGKNVAVFGEAPIDATGTFGSVRPVFYQTTNLKTIEVDPENDYFTVVDNILYKKDSAGNPGELVCCPAAYEGKTVTVASTTKIIYPYSLYALKNVENIILNEGLENIGKAAMYQSTHVTTMNIPASVKIVGASIGLGSGISSFTVSEGNEYYAARSGILYRKGDELSVAALPPQWNVKDVWLEEGLKTIDTGLFLGMGIETLHIPDSVTTIGDKAFRDCTALKEIYFGAGVSVIGAGATGTVETFRGLSALRKIEVAAGNKNYKVVEGKLYTADGKTLVLYPAANGDTAFLIESGVETIGEYAVNNHQTMKTVKLPAGVKTIAAYAFFDCYTIETLDTCESLISMGEYAFAFKQDKLLSSDALKTVFLYSGFRKLGNSAFYGQYGIENLYMNMSYTQARELTEDKTSANRVFLFVGATAADGETEVNRVQKWLYSETQPSAQYQSYKWYHLVNGEPVEWTMDNVR